MTQPAPLDPTTVTRSALDGTAAGQARTLTLSAERLTVSTRQVPVSTVRIERYQVTETRTITVDVLVDRIRIITTPTGQQPQIVDNPPADPNPADIHQGPADPEADVKPGAATGWLVLSEEQVVVTKQSVPVERIQLATTTVTQHRTVTEQVRTERLDQIDMTETVTDTPIS